MSIGVIRKWSIDPQRYPGLANYHRRSNPETPLSSLQNTSGGVGIQSKKTRPPCNYCGGIKNISGEPCEMCGDEGYADSGPPVTNLNLSEPMEISFRLLKELWECESCRATFTKYSDYKSHTCGDTTERWP